MVLSLETGPPQSGGLSIHPSIFLDQGGGLWGSQEGEPGAIKEDLLDLLMENFEESIKACVTGRGEMEETSDWMTFKEVEHYLELLEAHFNEVAKR